MYTGFNAVTDRAGNILVALDGAWLPDTLGSPTPQLQEGDVQSSYNNGGLNLGVMGVNPSNLGWYVCDSNFLHVASQSGGTLAFFKGLMTLAFLSPDSSNQLLVRQTWTSKYGVVTTQNSPVQGQSGQSNLAPSLAVFKDNLWISFISNDSNDSVLVCSSSDAQFWSANTAIGQSAKGSPCLAVFKNQLWIAFISNNSDNRILLCSSEDGVHWSGSTEIQGQSSQSTASLAVFKNKLWAAFISNDSNNRILLCSSDDGVHWSGNSEIKGQSSQSSPALVVVGDELWVVFASTDQNGQVVLCSSPNGTDWKRRN